MNSLTSSLTSFTIFDVFPLQDLLVHLDPRDREVRLDHKDLQDLEENLDLLDPVVKLDPKEHLENLDHKDNLDLLVLEERQDHKAHKDLRDLLDHLDPEENLDLLDHQVMKSWHMSINPKFLCKIVKRINIIIPIQ